MHQVADFCKFLERMYAPCRETSTTSLAKLPAPLCPTALRRERKTEISRKSGGGGAGEGGGTELDTDREKKEGGEVALQWACII